MMKTFKKFAAVAAILILVALAPLSTYAQDPNCPPDCPGNPGCPPNCVPIDGGLSLLIAAGIGLGAKKAYDRKKAAVRIAE